jgi:hypothetical protein
MTVEAGGLIARVVDFRRPLVRLDIPLEILATSSPPDTVELLAVGPARSTLGTPDPPDLTSKARSATLIGPAGHVDPASQFAGYWYEAGAVVRQESRPDSRSGMSERGPGDLAWRPGLFVEAHLKASGAKAQQSVSVPRGALLFHQGRTLVYVRLSPGRFERREVRLLGGEGERWVLADGVSAGEPVVSRQAQVLLAEEFKPQGDLDND